MSGKKVGVPVGYTVDGMSHAEMLAMVNRRINKLAMCKRGVLETEKNKVLEAHGNTPEFTKEEREKIETGLEKRLVKALTPTVGMLRKSANISSLADTLANKAYKIRQEAFIHPDKESWTKRRKQLIEQFDARMAVLDADFQEATDNFALGLYVITDLLKVLEDLEKQDW